MLKKLSFTLAAAIALSTAVAANAQVYIETPSSGLNMGTSILDERVLTYPAVTTSGCRATNVLTQPAVLEPTRLIEQRAVVEPVLLPMERYNVLSYPAVTTTRPVANSCGTTILEQSAVIAPNPVMHSFVVPAPRIDERRGLFDFW